MSIDALSWAFNLDLPNSGVKLTLLALANYADADDCTAYPSQKTMAQKTCLSTRAIRDHLVILEKLGVISRKSRKREDGTFTSDFFTLHVGFTPSATSGKNYQRQNLPTAKTSNYQRQNLPNPAAESAYQESSLTTTNTKSKPSVATATDAELQTACKATWKSYSEAYCKRYGIDPIRNARVNTAIKSFCKQIPHEEAPSIAAFFVSHSDPYYCKKTHHVSLMSTDAVGLRTQWATGKTSAAPKKEPFDGFAFVNKDAINPGERIEKPIN